MNKEYNLDKLLHDLGNNILYISGFSGGGKSTLAENKALEYNPAMVICLDTFANNRVLFDGSKELTSGDKIMKKYFYEKYDGQFPFKEPDTPFGHHIKGYFGHIYLFIQWIRKPISILSKSIFIIEGIQLALLYKDIPNLFTGKEPLIIVGASIEEAAKRATLRDSKDDYYGMSEKDYYQNRIKQNERVKNAMDILEKRFNKMNIKDGI